MKPEDWWKNFALGIEVDISGAFIYNGIKRLDELDNLGNASDLFEILYSLSVGIERILKVAVILLEHGNQQDMEAFEQSLISHDLMGLAHRVDGAQSLGLSGVHKELLSLLSKFYKTHRYGRFTIGSVPNIKAEQNLFLQYLNKHLQVELPQEDSFMPLYNSDQIRRFVGKVVHKLVVSVFKVVQTQATPLNIYTDELRHGSKAIRVFYGERLDFIDERIKKKELLLFLMHPDSQGRHIDLVRSFDALDFDPAMAPEYIRALLNDSHLHEVEGEVDELYIEVEDVGGRIAAVEIIDNPHVSIEDDDEDEEP
jgi:hypothetical protein